MAIHAVSEKRMVAATVTATVTATATATVTATGTVTAIGMATAVQWTGIPDVMEQVQTE